MKTVLIQSYYTTEGDNVFEHIKIGEGEWEKRLTPYSQVPYVINRWIDEEELKLLPPKVPIDTVTQ